MPWLDATKRCLRKKNVGLRPKFVSRAIFCSVGVDMISWLLTQLLDHHVDALVRYVLKVLVAAALGSKGRRKSKIHRSGGLG